MVSSEVTYAGEWAEWLNDNLEIEADEGNNSDAFRAEMLWY